MVNHQMNLELTEISVNLHQCTELQQVKKFN